MNIVVSGAGKGIGYEIVKLLDKEKDHRIFAISRNRQDLEKLDAETSTRTSIFPLDLISEDVEENIHQFLDPLDQIDILINNAGQLINKHFLDLSSADFMQMFQANVLSAVNLIRCLHPKLKRSTTAHIVNISSMGGFQGSSKFPGLSAYSSSKAALSNLTECLAEEFKEDGIVVNALALGAVQTKMLQNAFPGFETQMKADKMARFIIDFALKGQQFFNGKILPVSSSAP